MDIAIKSVRKYHSDTCSDGYNFVKHQQENCYIVTFEDGTIWSGNAKDREEAKGKAIQESKWDEEARERRERKEIEMITQSKMTTLDLLSGDKFFEENPDKLLGEAYEASGRFGKVTKYKGSLKEAVDRINAPMDMVTVANMEAPTISVIMTDSTLPTPEEGAEAIRVVENNRRKIAERAVVKTKTDSRDFSDPQPNPELFTFEETYEQCNRINPALPATGSNCKLSPDELKAYVWYMEQSGRKMSDKWYRLAGFAGTSADAEINIEDFIRRGMLFYHEGEYLPYYAYFSGNLYDRKTTLGRERETIINLYGEETFTHQKKLFDDVFEQKVYNNRLLIKPEKPERQLIILPNSDFARTFEIDSLDDGKTFYAPKYTDTIGNREKGKVGKADWKKVGGRRQYRFEEENAFSKMAIRDAFIFWLRYGGGDKQIKKNLSWLDIVNYYLDLIAYNEERESGRTAFGRKKAISKQEGDRLFLYFLQSQVKAEDQLRIETQWNRNFNSVVETDYDKIPVAFEYGKKFYGADMEIRWEKRECVAFISATGSGLAAYGVGAGKTISGIITIKHFIEAGWCKRPFIVVPNQTYRQWLSEIRNLLPGTKINDFYNLSTDYYTQMQDEDGNILPVESGSITVFTYEGFKRLGFGDTTLYEMIDELSIVLGQNDEDLSQKQEMGVRNKIETLMGRVIKGIRVEIESLGFDFMVVDEAHSMKKIFTRVASRKGSRNEYEIQSGTPSALGLKGFCIAQYIQRYNNGRNMMALTATPFTNSPLEVFSMLSLVAYQKLTELDQNNLRNFFDNYCMSSYELVISAKAMKPERKQVFLGWNNLQALQKLIFQFMNYKEADVMDDKGRVLRQDRPFKYVLPYERAYVNGILQTLPPKDQIKTSLSLSAQQKAQMDEVENYVIHGNEPRKATVIEVDDIPEADELTGEDNEMVDWGEDVDEGALTEKEKSGVRVLKGVNMARSLALSPYLYMFSNLGKPTYLEYVESSPKLLYVMQCVASVKKYHEEHNEPISGQIIYMDRGKDFFDLLKDYLVHVIGYKPGEVGIIKGSMAGGKLAKEKVKNLFNGERYDEATGAMIPVTDEERIKVLIGSRAIREGMNLQKRTSTGYNCYVDWNPTDQIQWEGRFFRQGNQFKYIRSVIPLMTDSMDIFVFQKLEEKTARINAIWNRDGKTNVLRLDDFDPREQKYNLITDPAILADMEVDEEKEKIQDEIAGISNQKELMEDMISQLHTVEYRKDEATKLADFYRPKLNKEGNPVQRSYAAIVTAIEDALKSQKLADGTSIKEKYASQETGWSYGHRSGGYGEMNINYNGEFSAPYWYKDWKLAVLGFSKRAKTILEPLGIKPDKDGIQYFIKDLGLQSESLQEELGKLTSEDAMRERISHIRAEQAKRRIGKVTPEMRVKEFEKLNYTLSEVKTKLPEAIVLEKLIDPAVCPPRTEDGKFKTDKASLVQLESCISLLPQTKQMHLLADETYTEKRKALHQKIILETFKGLTCVEHSDPICILTAGAPGSGKTFFLKRYAPYLLSDKIIRIDADEIRSKLPEYKGWNAEMTYAETKDIISEAISYIATPCKHDLLYDGTMNTPANYLPLIGKLRKLGYHIYIVFVEIPKEDSRKRVIDRYARTGRYVPLSIVDEFYAHAPNHFDEIKKKVNGWMRVDGMTGVIVERQGEEIPKEREYFTQDVNQLPSEPEIVEKMAETVITKTQIQSAVKSLRAAVDFMEGDVKAEMQSAIKSLSTMLEFM